MAYLGGYYYGKYKWDNYLLDIQQTIESGNAAQRQAVRLQEEALEVAHEQAEEMRRQTEQLHHIEEALNNGFEALRAEFEWGFTLMVDRMDRQIEQLSQITAKLDEIHKTLQSPLLTQARELFQLGQEHFRKGLLDKALEAYLKAEQKNDVDFPLQLQIGKLFLYGRDEDDNVIDLPQAEKHLLLAARYADAEKGTSLKWDEQCGQAYFHAAIASYLIGEKEKAEGRTDSMRSCLERALAYLAKAAIRWPQFTEIVYTEAKCHALLGQVQDAEQKLEVLSDRDRRYFAKAFQDGDFETFRADVINLFMRATISPGPRARATQAKLGEVEEAVTWAKRSAPTSTEDLAAIEAIEQELVKATQSLPTLNVDVETLSKWLSQTRSELEEIARRSLQANIDASQKAIASVEARKSSCEYSIGQLKQTMAATSGKGIGWTIGVLSYFVVPVLLAPVFDLTQYGGGFIPARLFLAAADIAIAIVAGIFGSKVWRDHKNQPHQQELDKNTSVIDQCVRELPSLRERTETWKRELDSFAKWQAQRPAAPLKPPSNCSTTS